MSGDESRTANTPIAVIDVGTNAVRMAIAQILPSGGLEVLERCNRPIRLGRDTFTHGSLRQRTLLSAVQILRGYRQILETYGVRRTRAVATTAIREAANADAFLDRVLMATGIELEVIEPTEEARLTVSAVREAINGVQGLLSDWTLIADVGGGGALLTCLENGRIAISESYRLGSIRLQEALSTTREPLDRAVEMLRNEIAAGIAAARGLLPLEKITNFLAVGGDARLAAAQVGKSIQGSKLVSIERASFDSFADQCAGLSEQQLARRFSLPVADAETLVPALLVYQELLSQVKADRMIVAHVSMRDGLLMDLARQLSGSEDDSLSESILRSAETIAAKYRYDAPHAQHVSAIAMQLFDFLQRDHGLGRRQRLLLAVAAVLHDVGGYVSPRSHHKHSYYLVANSDIFGLQRDEMRVLANVTRYHRRSAPKPTHAEYMSLPREQRMVVSKLAAILRVADSLDHGHNQHIRNVQFERHEDELVIFVPSVGDLTLEQRALAIKGGLFEDVYGMRVRLEPADAASLPDRRAQSVQ